MIREIYDNGVLLQTWNDTTRIYTSHHPNEPLVLTYAEKSAADGFESNYYDLMADRRAAMAATSSAREGERVTIKAIIGDIQIERDRAQTVIDNANSTPREKDLARAVKRIGAATIDLARFVKDL